MPKSKKTATSDKEVGLEIGPKDLTMEVQENIILICRLDLDHIYKKISYESFKEKFMNDLCLYMRIKDGENLVPESNKNFMELFNQYKNKVMLQPAFEIDPYMFPLFLLIFSIRDGSYDARNSVLIKNIIQCCKLKSSNFEKYEIKMVSLITMKPNQSKKFKSNKVKKYCKIAAATIIGGSLVGLTGGLLAAPFLAASLGTLIGSAWLTAAMGTTAGAGIIGTLFGATGAALAGYKMNKRTGILEEFYFQRIHSRGIKSLSVTIAVSGWISKDCDFTMPWKDLRITPECYALCWESKYLMEFGQGISYVANWATGQVAQELLKETILEGVLSSIAWPLNLLSLARVIDNPWSVVFARTKEAGKELANVLAARTQGQRPVNLIGFGLGARLIYHALNSLSKTPNEDMRGIVADVILMGAPIPANDKAYDSWMDVVAGRLINCYCERDWILKFLYRTSSVQYKVAGLEPMERLTPNARIYNINLTSLVDGHNDYISKMGNILKTLGYHASNFDD